MAVVDTLHFARAADILHMSPSTLSGQIAALEQSLGRKLFDRSPRAVLLTGYGQELVPLARDSLEAAERIARWARDPHPTILDIGTPASSAGFRAILQSAAVRLSHVGLRLRPSGFTGGLQALRARQVDCAFIFSLAPEEQHEGLRTTGLWSEDLVVAIPESHPFSGRDRITIEDLFGQTLIGPHSNDPEADAARVNWYEAIDSRLARQCSIRQLVDSVDEAMELVAAGVGLNIAGTSVISSYARPGVRFVPLETEQRVWVLLAARDEKPSPELEGFLRIATQTVS